MPRPLSRLSVPGVSHRSFLFDPLQRRLSQLRVKAPRGETDGWDMHSCVFGHVSWMGHVHAAVCSDTCCVARPGLGQLGKAPPASLTREAPRPVGQVGRGSKEAPVARATVVTVIQLCVCY